MPLDSLNPPVVGPFQIKKEEPTKEDGSFYPDSTGVDRGSPVSSYNGKNLNETDSIKEFIERNPEIINMFNQMETGSAHADKIILNFTTKICGDPRRGNIGDAAQATRKVFKGTINLYDKKGINIGFSKTPFNHYIITHNKKKDLKKHKLTFNINMNWKKNIKYAFTRLSLYKVFEFLNEKCKATSNDRGTQIIFLLLAASLLKRLSQITFNEDSVKKLNDQFVAEIKQKFSDIIAAGNFIIDYLSKKKIQSITVATNE